MDEAKIKEVVGSLAKRFYHVKFDAFGGNKLADVMEAVAQAADVTFIDNIVIPITQAITSQDTHDELVSQLPGVDNATLGMAKKDLSKAVVTAAVSTMVTRIAAAQSYNIFGLFAAEMLATDSVTEENIGMANNFVRAIIHEAFVDGITIGLRDCKEKLTMVDAANNGASH